MIKKVSLIAALMLSALTFTPTMSLAAGERATKAEAEAMVAKGVAAVKAKGDAVYVDITAPSKTYVDRDLYLVVYDITGKCLAHGQNPKQVGKDLLNLKDPDGKEFVKERVELANSKGKFWHDYKFTDPLTKTVQAKQAYCEKVGNVIVCGGIYKL
jgi:signal transduction histidine kinase